VAVDLDVVVEPDPAEVSFQDRSGRINNRRHCREVFGVDSLIPARERHSVRVVATTPLQREIVRWLGRPGIRADRAAYRQRWRAETVMSVVKRRCGEALTARLDETQHAQALLDGVAYNVQRLVRLDASA